MASSLEWLQILEALVKISSVVVGFTQVSSCFNHFKRQAHKMVKHTQKNRWQIADELFEFDHFVGLAQKELKNVRGFGKLVSLILQNRNDIFFFQPIPRQCTFHTPREQENHCFFLIFSQGV